MKYKKAIYSYWNPQRNGAGFNSVKDFLCMFSLSVMVSKDHFEEIEVYTDNWGVLLLDGIDLPIVVNNKLEELNKKKVPNDFWAYPKIVSYAEQKEPFIHIDNDVIMWDGIRKSALDKSYIFQSIEEFDKYTHYAPIIEDYKDMPIKPIELLKLNESVNFGVFASDDMELIKEYKDIVDKYIFSPENQEKLNSTEYIKSYQNIFFEQYFFMQLLVQKNLMDKVGLLFPQYNLSESDTNCEEYRYTHLWAGSKREKKLINKVKRRLKKDYKEIYTQIQKKKI